MDLVLQAFVLGIVYGIGPCTLSCAPVLVPVLMSTSKGYMQGLWHTLIFSIGRIVVYVALGITMGLIGRELDIKLPSWLVAAFLIALGIAVIFKVQNRCLVSRFRVKGPQMVFVTGLIMGLSPCAPMIAALGLSIASKSAIMGGLIALVFGIGTAISPLLIIGLATGKWASIREFAEVSNYVAGGFLIVLGLLNLLQ